MTREHILFFTVFMIGAVAAFAAKAQEASLYKPSCSPVFEEIVPMRVPNFDQAALWKRTAGVQGIDRPRALMRVVDGGVIAVGESFSFSEKEGLSSPRLQMLRFDANGKALIETYTDVKNLDHVVDALLKKTAVVILSHLKNAGGDDVSLIFLNGAGEKKDEKVLHDPTRNLIPHGFVSLPSGGFVILAEATNRGDKGDSYTALIWVDENGRLSDLKEYMPGVKSQPSSIRKVSDGGFVVAGRIESEKGGDAGWILRTTKDGDLVFQRPYLRGTQATLRHAAVTSDGGIVAVGDAIPAGEGDKAAWVLKTDAEGEPIWQKYLTGKYSYAAVDVSSLQDSRIMTAWAASPTSFGGRRFARVVTLSAQGYILHDESFLEGSNAIPFRVIQNGDARVMLGMAETGFSQEKREDELQYVTYDAWVMGMPALPKFENPCAGSAERKLDDLP